MTDREFLEPDFEHPGPRVGDLDVDEDTFTEPLPMPTGGPAPLPPLNLHEPDKDVFDQAPGEEYRTHSEPWRLTARQRLYRETSQAITHAHEKVAELMRDREHDDFIVATGMLRAAHEQVVRQLRDETDEHRSQEK